MDDTPLSLLIAALVLLIVLSAFFSGSETGLMTLNRYRLRHLADRGHPGAIRAERLLERQDRLIGLILLAIQDRHLHNRQPGGFIRALPPLQVMEALLFQMIGVGYVLLTLALLTGILFLEDIFAQHLVHKTVLSIIAWLVFGILLWGRWHFGWRGRVAIRWTIGGFIFLMLAYFGSKFVLELILNR